MLETTTQINGRAEFQEALRTAFAEAATAGCGELLLSDRDFSDWPLGERGVIESLTTWVSSRRRMTLFASGFDAILRLHPRWITWRRDWAHVVTCRTNPELQPDDLPTILLASDLLSVELVDRVHHRGSLRRGPRTALSGREAVDALMQRSVEAFPATTTGL